MTKDVLLSIKGLQIGENEQNDTIEVISPGRLLFSEWQAFFYVRGGHGRSERIDQEHD